MSQEMHSVVLNPTEDYDRDKKPHAQRSVRRPFTGGDGLANTT